MSSTPVSSRLFPPARWQSIPAAVVCHAPFGAQTQDTVAFDLWHGSTQRQQRQSQQDIEQLRQQVSCLRDICGGEGEKEDDTGQGIQSRQQRATGNQHRLLILRLDKGGFLNESLPD